MMPGLAQLRSIDWQLAFWRTAALLAARFRRSASPILPEQPAQAAARKRPAGISVVIPSRNGRDLLAAQMAGVARDLAGLDSEIIVVDNGSSDGTSDWLRQSWPRVEVELSAGPLSFARAVNRGISRARYSHVCLLNNDMLLEPGFFRALLDAFGRVPDLFSATAQILFPPGARREETGKTVIAEPDGDDFPIRCDVPLPGEDHSYVLYGSGGCSLYDAARLEALGGVDESYEPVYVEDLDLGYRAWLRGWPSVYVAGAVVEHRHRTTTSRYYTEQQLDEILGLNYLRFLARAVASPGLFRRMWAREIRRLRNRRMIGPLRAAVAIALRGGAAQAVLPDEFVQALNTGAVAVFPGCAPTGRPRTLHVAAALPLSGPAPPAGDSDLILVAYTSELAPPPAQLLSRYVEIVVVVRRPEPHSSSTFHAALRQTVRKWSPALACIEPGEMAAYAADCTPARTV